jgi:type I restriction enzyme, S subunit
MILTLKPYPDYRDSGHPWLGKVPAHWGQLRTKYLFSEVDERSIDGLETHLSMSQRRGLVAASESSGQRLLSESYAGAKKCRQNDLVLNRLKAHLGVFAHASEDGLVSPDYTVFRCKGLNRAKFFEYQFKTPEYVGEFRRSTKGIVEGFWRLYTDDFYKIIAAVPPAHEQDEILDWIERFDGKIKQLAAAKRRVIELLNEHKLAIIHRAVTRSLDSNVRLKHSGVEWLGEIPAHWEIKRLKWVTRLQRGYDLPSERRLPGAVPVVSSGGTIGTHNEARAEAPGVVMGRYGSTDSVFYLEEAFWPHNTALFVTDFQSNFPRWCYYLLRVVSKIDLGSKSAVPGVDRKDLYEIEVAVPPVGEQPLIVEQTENRLGQFAKVTQSVQHQLDLLREYRTRIIVDVVTGKLDVRGVELPELNEVEGLSFVEELEDSEELEAIEDNVDAD